MGRTDLVRRQGERRTVTGKDVLDETALPTIAATMENLDAPEVADNLYRSC